jgi:aryl-alcohol dehydrogenase-like predicted oxidoreductase
MAAFCDAGIVTFDCADIYIGVEELVGRFRAEYAARRGAAAQARLKVHTKFVPDLPMLPRMSRGCVQSVIDRSLQSRPRRLDLVQFHWWDYAVPGCLEQRSGSRAKRAGKIDLPAAQISIPHVEALGAQASR